MNTVMIKHLFVKDWQFCRNALAFYFAIGVASLFLISVASKLSFYVGIVLLVSILIIIGAHLIFVTVVNERKEQTLSFVMSLPVTFSDYTVAKLIANIVAFLIPWGLLVAGVLSVISFNADIPNGLIPFALIVLLELFVAYLLVLSVALITESEVWTIVMTTICNIGVSLFWFWISSFAGISKHIQGETAIWNTTAASIILIELMIAALIIIVTFWCQSRKTDFL
ncbi:ABC-2 transporter permease [Aliikangiella coralliicola]|uniref:Uncharacterized protein n=1 Tax=Aliikangiella coralliicola TaxID=2592383 RepID=A0A545UBU1_9GAMM|nr:ABC-2 transporter permease [Aliikangiella coralliicola]TQV86935.1 hypothetical protein FLL46_14060 [Aliikangiella coralliicola]